MFISLPNVTKQQLPVVLFVNQSFSVGNIILQKMRHHKKASDNQYGHISIYILKSFLRDVIILFKKDLLKTKYRWLIFREH